MSYNRYYQTVTAPVSITVSKGFQVQRCIKPPSPVSDAPNLQLRVTMGSVLTIEMSNLVAEQCTQQSQRP